MVVAINNPAEMKQALQFDGKAYVQYITLKAIELARQALKMCPVEKTMYKHICLLAASAVMFSVHMTMIKYGSISSTLRTLKPQISHLLCRQAFF